MTFQASNLKGKQFLNLLDNNNTTTSSLNLSILKKGLGSKYSVIQIFLCTYAMRAITNHAPTGKYRLRFFPKEEFKCPCRSYPIKSKHYILHECGRFNGY